MSCHERPTFARRPARSRVLRPASMRIPPLASSKQALPRLPLANGVKFAGISVIRRSLRLLPNDVVEGDDARANAYDSDGNADQDEVVLEPVVLHSEGFYPVNCS